MARRGVSTAIATLAMTCMVGSLGLLGFAAITQPANAQNAACRGLGAQLARLDRNPGNSNPNYAKWNRNVTDQRRAMRQTERQARSGNCRINGKAGFGTPHAKCGQIESTLSKMKSNLARLERRRDRYAGNGGSSANEKRAIRRKMQRLQCGAKPKRSEPRQAEFKRRKPVRTAEPSSRSRVFVNPGRRVREGEPREEVGQRRSGPGLFSLLFGQPARNAGRNNDREFESGTSAVRYRRRERINRSPRFGRQPRVDEDFFDDFSSGSFSGTYRTMCVRQCDGYYFPISFSTTEAMFDRDADLCSRLCPSGDSELFVHENPGSTPESMTSLDGRAYTELPNAFEYRRAFNKKCSCRSAYGKITTLSRLHVGNGILQVRKKQPTPLSVDPNLPMPLAKRPVDLDPDSRMNLIGKYLPITKRPVVAKNRPVRQTVRIVGPKYFYGQQE